MAEDALSPLDAKGRRVEQEPTRRLAMRQGRSQADWTGTRSTADNHARQNSPELLESSVSDFRSTEAKFAELH